VECLRNNVNRCFAAFLLLVLFLVSRGWAVSASEEVAVSDDVYVVSAPWTKVVETLSISDEVSVAPAPRIRAGEDISVTDTVVLSSPPWIKVAEDISVSDTVFLFSPPWVKVALDRWAGASGVYNGRVFRG